ncbi:MAG: hypothetical protein ACRD1C_07525 [Terriglobales bacterium]
MKTSKAQILCETAIKRRADAMEADQHDAMLHFFGVMSQFHHYSF